MQRFLVLTAIVAAAAAQQQCGCAPQPVTIQLSCGSGSKAQAPSYPPPPPPPPFNPGPPPASESPSYEYSEAPVAPASEAPAEPIYETSVRPTGPFSRVQDDPRRDECVWQNSGTGDYFITWNYTYNNGPAINYMWLNKWDDPTQDKYSNIKWYNAPDNTKPPRGWDGSFDSLPYPKPAEDSLLYWWLLCYPLVPEDNFRREPSILDDPNRAKCNWQMDYSKYDDVNGEYFYYGYPRGELPGGFPIPFRVADRHQMDNKKEVQIPLGFNRPPHNWDGRASTLGFPIPERNTPEYNMLLCWPYDFNVKDRAPVALGAAGR